MSFHFQKLGDRYPYHAGVSSDRTNLSPFTKDYRGLALQCDLAVFRALRGHHNKHNKPTKKCLLVRLNFYTQEIHTYQKICCTLENGGFDPPTSSLRTTRASDCANSPKAASIGTRTRLLCLEGIDTTPVLWTQHNREQEL